MVYMAEFFTTSDFSNSLGKLDQETQRRIKEKVTFFADQENPILFAKKLKGYKDVFRFRVGDYRIVFQLSEKKIILLLVKHRREIYAS